MADEIKISKTIAYQNGQLKYSYSPGAINLPQATRGYSDKTVAVTSAEQDITGVTGTPGITLLRNLAATTTGVAVVWGTTEGLIFRLGPKEDAQFSLATSTGVIAIQTAGAVAGGQYVQFLQFEK
jgi:hypothetical protein